MAGRRRRAKDLELMFKKLGRILKFGSGICADDAEAQRSEIRLPAEITRISRKRQMLTAMLASEVAPVLA